MVVLCYLSLKLNKLKHAGYCLFIRLYPLSEPALANTTPLHICSKMQQYLVYKSEDINCGMLCTTMPYAIVVRSIKVIYEIYEMFPECGLVTDHITI